MQQLAQDDLVKHLAPLYPGSVVAAQQAPGHKRQGGKRQMEMSHGRAFGAASVGDSTCCAVQLQRCF